MNISNKKNFAQKAFEIINTSVLLINSEFRFAKKSGWVAIDKYNNTRISSLYGTVPDCMIDNSNNIYCGYKNHCSGCTLLSNIVKTASNKKPIKNSVSTDLTPKINNKIYRFNSESTKIDNTDSTLLVIEEIDQSLITENWEIENNSIQSSIRYAKNIQRALLPDKFELQYLLKNYLLYYKPKDIIGGDFYWVTKQKDKTIIAAGDGTGHGVPGSLISVLGISALNEIIKTKQISIPDQILSKLSRYIATELYSYENPSQNLDSIDISVCTIDTKTNKILFAGVSTKIVLVSNNNLVEIKGENLPISAFHTMSKFKLHEIEYKNGDMLYLFSDGYKDQFGGIKDKKLGKKRFYEILKSISHLSMPNQKRKLEYYHQQWKQNQEQIDDIMVLGIRL